MAIYLVVPLDMSSAALDLAVLRTIEASDRFKLQGERGWLIWSAVTSAELSNQIGITNPANTPTFGSAIVVAVSSYWGRGPTGMWEWLKTRMER